MDQQQDTNFLPHNYDRKLEYSVRVSCLRLPKGAARTLMNVDAAAARRLGWLEGGRGRDQIRDIGESDILAYHLRDQSTQGKFAPGFTHAMSEMATKESDRWELVQFAEHEVSRLMEAAGFGKKEDGTGEEDWDLITEGVDADPKKEDGAAEEDWEVVTEELDDVAKSSSSRDSEPVSTLPIGGSDIQESLIGGNWDDDSDSDYGDDDNDDGETIYSRCESSTTTTSIGNVFDFTDIYESVTPSSSDVNEGSPGKYFENILTPSSFESSEESENEVGKETAMTREQTEAFIRETIQTELDMAEAEGKEEIAAEKLEDLQRFKEGVSRNTIRELASFISKMKAEGGELTAEYPEPVWEFEGYQVVLTKEVARTVQDNWAEIEEKMSTMEWVDNRYREEDVAALVRASAKYSEKEKERKTWMFTGQLMRHLNSRNGR